MHATSLSSRTPIQDLKLWQREPNRSHDESQQQYMHMTAIEIYSKLTTHTIQMFSKREEPNWVQSEKMFRSFFQGQSFVTGVVRTTNPSAPRSAYKYDRRQALRKLPRTGSKGKSSHYTTLQHTYTIWSLTLTPQFHVLRAVVVGLLISPSPAMLSAVMQCIQWEGVKRRHRKFVEMGTS